MSGSDSPVCGAFTRLLWKEVAGIYHAILGHPFVQGLTRGDLPRESFVFYVVQDALYLKEFARALSLAAARSDREDWILTFNEHAASTLKVERALHQSVFRDLGLTEAAVRETPPAPTCLAYTSYLVSVACARPVPEIVAALLPCYWVYWEVGKAMVARGSPEPLYQRWIDTYSAKEFGALVEEMLGLTNTLAEAATEDQREAMRRHFVTSTRHEWMFWDMGWRRERWPV